MVSLLAALTGFLGSLMPYIINILRDVSDKKHELKILEMQIEMQKLGVGERLEEIKLVSEISEFKELHNNFKINVKWVDAFNGTVRPVLAYSFFLLYVFVKWKQAYIISKNEPLFLLAEVLWSVDDQAIFAGIISFYFGQRTLSKIKH